MIYYNIHTHRTTEEENTVSIENRIIEKEMLSSCSSFSSLISVGIHPWYLNRVDEQLSVLRETVLQPEVVAIGEAGLDKLTTVSLPLQQYVFLEQAALAEEVSKPLIIHCVKAWDEIIATKKKVNPRMPWIIHGFRGNHLLAIQLIKQGFYLSFSTRFNPAALCVEILPRLFFETDEATLPVKQIYAAAASYLNIETEVLAEQIAQNIHRVFSF